MAWYDDVYDVECFAGGVLLQVLQLLHSTKFLTDLHY